MTHPTPAQISGHRDRICAMSTDLVVHESANVMAEAYRDLYAENHELARIHGDLLARYELLIDQQADEPQFLDTMLAQVRSVIASLDEVKAQLEVIQ